MRRTKEEALVTRENVLTAALDVFSRDGYSAARLEDIARSAEVTRGAIYHHFGSKEELYKALVTERSVGINQLAEEVFAQGGTPLEVIRRLLLSLIEYMDENPEYRALLELATSKVEHTEGLESIREDTIMGRRQLSELFEELLRQGNSGMEPCQLYEWLGSRVDPRSCRLLPSRRCGSFGRHLLEGDQPVNACKSRIFSRLYIRS